MSLRTLALLVTSGALLAACSGQPSGSSSEATATDAASTGATEVITVPPSTEDAAGSEGATTGRGSYTLDEVAAHATKEDCWTAIDGVVYDLTKFVSSHPGGEGAIAGLCGKDGTEGFNSQHGSDADVKSKLDSFEIGVVSN